MNKIIASILIIVVLGLTIWYVADNQKQLPLTGGGCAYKEYPGKCTINGVVVKNADPDSGGSFESPTVNYTFVPAGSVDVSGTYLSSADKINPYNGITAASYLGLYCLRGPFSPNYHQTLNCGVLDGALFDCVLSVATAGSCNPINILFVDSGSCAKEGEYQGYSAGRSDVKRQCCAGLSAIAATNL